MINAEKRVKILSFNKLDMSFFDLHTAEMSKF